MNKIERYLALFLFITILLFGRFYLADESLFFRLLVGLGFGYTLSRSYMGFAGSVNRAYQTGSTKLIRSLMFMFFMATLFTTGVLYGNDATKYDLWINPINLGLIIGGILFGIGMTFSACCASGVLVSLVEAIPRAFITLFFFALGVFIGFPLQNTQEWIIESWISSETGIKIGYNGVYLPDLFKSDGIDGYLGAIFVTACFCGIVIWIAYAYEKYRKKKGDFNLPLPESYQALEAKKQLEKESNTSNHFNLFSEDTYKMLFVNPWSMKMGALIIAGIFVILMGVTKAGWGASTPYGLWFGKLLISFGISSNSISSFTHMSADPFIQPFFEHPINVQNIGIILGALLYILCCQQFFNCVRASMRISLKQGISFAIGGLLMGFGTRLANGCNVGALFTPIANFSLSGWIYLIFLVGGGIMGNKIARLLKL